MKKIQILGTEKAHKMSIQPELIQQAIEIGRMVRQGAANQMDELLKQISD